MIAVPPVMAAGRMPGRDNTSWQDQIDRALATPDPLLANMRITAAHYHLSLVLHQILGPDTGANFHTWATWGSKKAGQTIRQEEVPQLGVVAFVVGGSLGLLVAAVAAQQAGVLRLLACAAGILLGGWGLQTVAQRRRDHASRMILGGNSAVLDDIGRQTARFVAVFQGYPAPDPQRLAAFLAVLRPGPSAAGGQDLLQKAFTHYYHARHAPCRAQRHDHMLLANLYAILHEQLRLQPYIAGAMPRLARRLITRYLLAFSLGPRTLSVSADVVPRDDGTLLPSDTSAELQAFLGTWGRGGDGVLGSHATNWADLRDRMAFICALFRTGHGDTGLFVTPYTATQWGELAAGRAPGGAL